MAMMDEWITVRAEAPVVETQPADEQNAADEEQNRTERLQVRLSPDELAQFKHLARAHKPRRLRPGTLLRQILIEWMKGESR